MKYSDQKKLNKNKYSSHTPVIKPKETNQNIKQASQILKQIDNKIQQINHLNINHLKTQNVKIFDKENQKTLINNEKESKHFNLQENIYCLDQKSNQLKQISTTLNLNQLCNEDIKIGNFKLEQVLGQGSFAQVRLCIQKNSQIKYAMKIYDKMKLNDTQKMNNIKREISILKRIDHKNIIKLIYAIQDSKSIYLVMEYISNQSLASFVKSKAKKCLEQQEALYIFQQIVQAVYYLHSKNIAHRDIKLDNILLMTDNYVKLIDFGFSICTPESQKINVFCGTPSYMSPELVGKIPHNPMSSDMWSLGILLYRILFGDYPFKGQNDRDLYKAIQQNKINLPQDLNENISVILKGCLEKNISKRFTIEQLVKNLYFLQTVNIYAL